MTYTFFVVYRLFSYYLLLLLPIIDLCQDYVNEIALRNRKKKVIIENKFKNMYKKKGVNLGIK
jgi:hypothetical protein